MAMRPRDISDRAIAKEAPVQLPHMTETEPTGISFAIPDLLMVQAWADDHDMQMLIGLDAVAGDNEYEEIISLTPDRISFRRWLIWRSHTSIVVQPMVGRSIMFDVMTDALNSLSPEAE